MTLHRITQDYTGLHKLAQEYTRNTRLKLQQSVLGDKFFLAPRKKNKKKVSRPRRRYYTYSHLLKRVRFASFATPLRASSTRTPIAHVYMFLPRKTPRHVGKPQSARITP